MKLWTCFLVCWSLISATPVDARVAPAQSANTSATQSTPLALRGPRSAWRPDLGAQELAQEAWQAARDLAATDWQAPEIQALCAQALKRAGLDPLAQEAMGSALRLLKDPALSDGAVRRGRLLLVEADILGLKAALTSAEELGPRPPGVASVDESLPNWDLLAALALHLAEQGAEEARALFERVDRGAPFGVLRAPSLAQMAVAAQLLGDEGAALDYEFAVLDQVPLDWYEYDAEYLPALEILVRGLAQQGVWGSAQACIEESLREVSIDVGLGAAHGLRPAMLHFAEALTQAGQVEALTGWSTSLPDPLLRSTGLALAAEARHAADQKDALASVLAEAEASAAQCSPEHQYWLAQRFLTAGLRETAVRLFDLAERQPALKEYLAKDAVELARVRAAALIVTKPDVAALAKGSGNELQALAIAMAYSFRAGLHEQGLRCYEQLLIPSARADGLAETAKALFGSTLPARQRSEYLTLLVDRARQIETRRDMAHALATIALHLPNLEPEEELFPWILPPTMAGTWSLPSAEQHARAATALQGHLAARGLPQPQLRAQRCRELRCYADGRLYELEGVLAGWPRLYLLLELGPKSALLDGTSRGLLELQAAMPPQLDSDMGLLEYATLFASIIGGPDGRFRVLPNSTPLAELASSGASLPNLAFQAPRILKRLAEGAADVELDLAWAGKVFRAVMTIQADGRATLDRDTPLHPEALALDAESFEASSGAVVRHLPIAAAAQSRLESEPGPAAFEIGLQFALGHGAGGWRCDEDLAVYWLQRATAAGEVGAFHRVADAWARGAGVPANTEQAALWLAHSLQTGYGDSAFELGQWLAQSYSPRRRDQGLQILRQGYELKHARSTCELGRILARGLYGVPIDAPEALRLLEQAADWGSGYAHLNLGLIHTDATLGARNLPRAAEHFTSAAAIDQPLGHYFLGILCANGQGDPREAEALYLTAANADIVAAQVVLALRYESGLGMASGRNLTQARHWASRASTAGHRFGALIHARLLARDPTQPDPSAARSEYQRALTINRPSAALLSFVDPAYLTNDPSARLPGTPLDANAVLATWSAAIEAELKALLDR
jgi:TPR repeat protein